jgi:hypothetical protein
MNTAEAIDFINDFLLAGEEGVEIKRISVEFYNMMFVHLRDGTTITLNVNVLPAGWDTI